MRIIEEAQLKDFITKVDNYSARFPVPETFFANLNRLGAVSLQDFSYEKDNAFFCLFNSWSYTIFKFSIFNLFFDIFNPK